MKNYNQILEENRAWAEEAFAKIDKKMSAVTLRSRDKLVDGVDANGVHKSVVPRTWTSGFWGGLNLLLFERTKNEEYYKTAMRSEELLDKALFNFEELYHDVGFMWHILSGANFALTGNAESRNRNLFAASSLFSRYVLNGGFIRAWNNKWQQNDVTNWTIIDCMMNLPLLYWASEELGDDRFKQIAMAHADTAMTHHVRPDGSVNHIVVHDLESGEMIGVHGGQGFSGTSCWTRGEAWGLYGYILSYIHTKEQRYLDTAKRIANYTIAALAACDYLPPIDFRSPERPDLFDSTAGAIMACGLIEIAKAVPEHEAKTYIVAAMRLLKAMEAKFCDWTEEKDAILLFGSEDYHGRGHNMPIIYGDYFFTEAILKLKGTEFLAW